MEINNEGRAIIHFTNHIWSPITWHVLGSNAGLVMQWRESDGVQEKIADLQVLTNEFFDHLVRNLNEKLLNHEINH